MYHLARHCRTFAHCELSRLFYSHNICQLIGIGLDTFLSEVHKMHQLEMICKKLFPHSYALGHSLNNDAATCWLASLLK